MVMDLGFIKYFHVDIFVPISLKGHSFLGNWWYPQNEWVWASVLRGHTYICRVCLLMYSAFSLTKSSSFLKLLLKMGMGWLEKSSYSHWENPPQQISMCTYETEKAVRLVSYWRSYRGEEENVTGIYIFFRRGGNVKREINFLKVFESEVYLIEEGRNHTGIS